MAKMTKRFKQMRSLVEPGKPYPVDQALDILRTNSKVKFVEAIDVAVRLGIDARKSDQNVRSSTLLPNGTGKTVRVAVFAQGENATKALEAGADVVGFEDLAERMQGGELNFDTVIASPDAMRVVGKLGQLLGPRGLMPNPKVGTVTSDVAGAVKNAKSGQVRYRNDKGGIIHCTIGKVSFEAAALKENLQALLADLNKARPAGAKGQYIRKITVSSTMGLGIVVDQATLESSQA